jgi:hypothetical protein
MSMTIGPVHTAWLFTRGSESVRIIRVGQNDGAQYLLVNGPGTETNVHHTADSMECARHQCELERRLVGKGFRLERFASGDRRRGSERRTAPRGPDRRTYLERVV